jgi:hypothetical protein
MLQKALNRLLVVEAVARVAAVEEAALVAVILLQLRMPTL